MQAGTGLPDAAEKHGPVACRSDLPGPLSAALYYANHLDGRMRIVVLSDALAEGLEAGYVSSSPTEHGMAWHGS